MKIKAIKINRFIPLLLCAVVCFMVLFGIDNTMISHAGNVVDGKIYTDVLTDLSKDPEFNPDDYPALQDGDYSLNVIQLAEGSSGEVFIYVYEPRRAEKAFTALFLNMALGESVDSTELYDLKFINAMGVFCKYTVVGLTVSSEDVRFYNITSIYRTWQKGYDDESVLDNETGCVSFPVGKKFRVTTVDNVPKYECIAQDVIEILNPFVGFIEYENGFYLYQSWCNSHFLAFSTDLPINELFEVDVEFRYQGIHKITGYGSTSTVPFTSKEKMKSTLNGESKGSTGSIDDWSAAIYEWSRIQSVSEFILSEKNLKKEVIETLKNETWVLRFCETEVKQYWSDIHGNPDPVGGACLCKRYTEISDVTVLRLKFEYNGKTYDLGAVSNMVTGGNKPSNKKPLSWWELFLLWLKDNWYWLVIGIVGIVLLIVIMPFMPTILSAVVSFLRLLLKGLWWLIKHLCIALWWIISAPFRLIKWIIDKIRERKDGAS